MKKYKCTSKHAIKTEVENWLPFAQHITVEFDNLSFKMKGIWSKDSVMVVPFKLINGIRHVGIIKEQRPLFCGDKWLAGFPAGKIEDEQTPEEAAKIETLQEAGLTIKKIIFVGEDIPFPHICSEHIFMFVAEVEERENLQQLEAGEWIDSKIIWMPWNEFKFRIICQQKHGTPVLKDTPMVGMSLNIANKILTIGIDDWE